MKIIGIEIGLAAVLLMTMLLSGCPAATPAPPLKVIATEIWSYQANGNGYFVLSKYEDNSIKVTGGCVTDTNTGTNIICNITSGTATVSNATFWELVFSGTTVNFTPTCQFQQALDGVATNGYISGPSFLTGFFDGSSMNIIFGVGWTGHLLSGSNITTNF